MTRDDVIKTLSLLKAAYPAFYAKMPARDVENAVALWVDMFADDDPRVIALAVKGCIETHDGYPPSIAAIKNRAKQLVREASDAPATDDLWTMFSRACSNGIYNSTEEFEKLPYVLQRFAGSPRALYDYAIMASDTFNSVVRGQFYKRMQEIQEQEEHAAMMPPEVKELLQGVAKRMPCVENAKIDEGRHDEQIQIPAQYAIR